MAYDKLNKFEKAIIDYTKALEIDPTYVDAYNNRGVSYKNIKQYDKAIQDYLKALELNPKHSVASKNLENIKNIIKP